MPAATAAAEPDDEPPGETWEEEELERGYAPWEVRVLGPVEVVRDGERVPLGGPRPRALLALLALEAGSAVSVARLARTFDLPVVLSTINVAHGPGPTIPTSSSSSCRTRRRAAISAPCCAIASCIAPYTAPSDGSPTSVMHGGKTLAEGQAVEFEVQAGDNGLHATDVTRA